MVATRSCVSLRIKVGNDLVAMKLFRPICMDILENQLRLKKNIIPLTLKIAIRNVFI
jgi:hypothetical protein